MSEEPGGTTLCWWWVRHAPIAGPADIIHGNDDAPADLSDTAALAQIARRLPADAVALISGARRASDTYEALRQANSGLAAAAIDGDLAEQDFGDWTGRTWTELAPETATFWKDPVLTAPPRGESFATMSQRVQVCVIGQTAMQRSGDIVAVSHAGPIRAALALALDLPLEGALRFVLDCPSLTRIDAITTESGLAWRIRAVNVR